LHHALAEGRVAGGILNYLVVFFAIWWAWMNFTWFASAYDTDDGLYRVATLVQIAGGLVLAAGIPSALHTHDLTVITVGYVIMRLAMVGQWLRAAKDDPPRRRTALRYAAGIGLVQVGWILRLGLPPAWFLSGFLVLALAEVLVPLYAERAGATTWHPRHIAERYGCFTLIVLGESVLSMTTAIQAGVEGGEDRGGLVALAVSALVIVFAMWWLYFAQSGHERLTSLPKALVWGYGHYVIFAAVAAVGAGLGVSVDAQTHHSTLGARSVALGITAPVAIYFLGVWLLHVLPRGGAPGTFAFPVVAALLLAAPLTPWAIQLAAFVAAALVLVTTVRRPRGGTVA
jgi:low temperature requirement protein LtrA